MIKINKATTIRNNLILLRKIFHYNKTAFFLRIFVALLDSVSTVLTIVMPMYLIEAILGGDLREVLFVAIVFTALFLIIRYINIAYAAYESVVRGKFHIKIIDEFLLKTIGLDIGFFDDTTSYDKYNRAFGNCCDVVNSVNAILTSLVTAIFNVIFIVGLLVWMDLYMFAVIFAAIAVSILVNNKLKRIEYDFSKSLSEKNKQVNYLYRLFYVPQLIREMKVNDLSNHIFKIKQDFDGDIVNLTKKQEKQKVPYNVLLGTLNILESSFVAVYFGFSVILQRIVIAEYFTFVNAFNQLKNTIMNLTSVYTQLYRNSLFASDYIDYLDSKETSTTNEAGEILTEVKDIEFVNVSFKYPNNDTLALNNVSFKISGGDRVAIIGKNGAGKTTIIKLLLRLYDPIAGEILINSINVKDYNTKSLRTTIQTLFQDFELYAFSIKENISLGRDVSQNDIWGALEKVDLKEKIKNLKHSLNTPITSQLHAEGVELSGGEAQKIAIARIYANKPKTFIMDEPTSSLDPYSEYQLYHKLMENSDKGSIVVVISHRLTLTYKMSKIMVINNGCLIEQGSHNELMSLQGIYYEMYNIQAEKYSTQTN